MFAHQYGISVEITFLPSNKVIAFVSSAMTIPPKKDTPSLEGPIPNHPNRNPITIKSCVTWRSIPLEGASSANFQIVNAALWLNTDNGVNKPGG